MNYYDYGSSYGSSYNSGLAGLSTGLSVTTMIMSLIPSILLIVGMWKTFEKAGKPGWAAIVPFYNVWTVFEIGGQKGAYVFFALIPCVGPIIYLVFAIKAYLEIARRFGKSTGFGVLSIFFSFITFLILGFSDCTYEGNTAEAKSSILDVNENGVPNSSDQTTFNYGYQDQNTQSMNPVNNTTEQPVNNQVNNTPVNNTGVNNDQPTDQTNNQ